MTARRASLPRSCSAATPTTTRARSCSAASTSRRCGCRAPSGGSARRSAATRRRRASRARRGPPRTMRSPLYWPLLPFERFGPGPTWLVAVAVIFGLRAAGLETASGDRGARLARALHLQLDGGAAAAAADEGERVSEERLDGLRAAVELSPDNHGLRLVLAEALRGEGASRGGAGPPRRAQRRGRAAGRRARRRPASSRSRHGGSSSPPAAWRPRAGAASSRASRRCSARWRTR